jgi:arginase
LCVIEAAGDQIGADSVSRVRTDELPGDVLGSVAAINCKLASAVRGCLPQTLPIVLAGNCNSCLGTLAGIGGGRMGIVWLDAHGDFHTPETSRSGFLDGMALAAAVGHCHRELAAGAGLKQTAEAADVVVAGTRDLEDAEELRMQRHGVRWVDDAAAPGQAAELVRALNRNVEGVYLHVDVDFLNPKESPGANYRGGGGVPVADGEKLIFEIARSSRLRGVAFTNYNPDRDPLRATAAVVVRLIQAVRKGISD